jgi:hypothetical protein
LSRDLGQLFRQRGRVGGRRADPKRRGGQTGHRKTAGRCDQRHQALQPHRLFRDSVAVVAQVVLGSIQIAAATAMSAALPPSELLRLDAGVADHLAETVDVGGEQLDELFRRARRDVDRLRRDFLHHLRRIRRLDEFPVQLAHDLGRRAGGRDDTLPDFQLGSGVAGPGQRRKSASCGLLHHSMLVIRSLHPRAAEMTRGLSTQAPLAGFGG